MTKPLDVVNESVHNPKHPFRQLQNCPGKPRKNRYERRKVRELLRAGDWSDGVE